MTKIYSINIVIIFENKNTLLNNNINMIERKW